MSNASEIIKMPLVTEKSTYLSETGQYVFIVDKRATKSEVAKAIKVLYNVDVIRVNIQNKPAKSRRFRNLQGHRPGFKKATVALKEGQKIDLT